MYISTFILLAASLISVQAQQLCNGYADYCGKTYNSLTHVLTHNSYGYVANPAANQQCPITTQLADGVRGLKLSAVSLGNTTNDSNIYLCHTSCNILNAGPAVNTLTTITEWLKSNPNEVITIMWNQMGSFNADAFKTAYQASGILDYTYIQAPGDYKWPTLAQMISSGKRVVNFIDSSDFQSTLPWLLDEFKYVFETPYNNQNEASFTCTIDRPESPSNPSQMMYVMNHFLYGTLNLGSTKIEIPQKGSANVTNAEGSLMVQAQKCTETFGRQPNFLEVDFYNLGNTLKIAAELNKVAYTQPSSLQCDMYVSQHTGSSSAVQTFSLSSMSVLLSLTAATFFAFL
ncbi:PLC-like phosphodiesterase [Sporodiniella umbellata]|nr:PLC-like phosphodiesterase [Sporodiniella umbellata]